MRPRSRLLAKRGLPTIREGSEELVHDLNQTNSQHSSAQDYFHSICQLARPTFPLHEPDRDILSIGKLDSPKLCLRPHRLRQLAQPLTCHIGTSTNQSPKLETLGPSSLVPEKAQGSEQDCQTSTDPLEYLYGYRDAEASCSSSRRGSVPCPGLEVRNKSTCPDLRLPESVPSPVVPQRSPLSRKKLDGGKVDGAHCGCRAKSSRSIDKQTIVSHWISECRSAWREARIRACMLPAIAEK
ncbi:protein DEPP1 [Tachysurus ichikawai]